MKIFEATNRLTFNHDPSKWEYIGKRIWRVSLGRQEGEKSLNDWCYDPGRVVMAKFHGIGVWRYNHWFTLIQGRDV